ncbi:MAG: hypothetical protein M5U09_13505 [Gammaproteobacteria bacterium]|nr:hypothetical protein [Gammaproteobacteria bacterium]
MVASSISIDYLNNFYDAVRPGETGIIGLFHLDGPILAGSPFSPDHNGFDASQTTRFHELLPTSESGTLRADMIDGINRIKAYAWVPDLPLVVLVGVGTAERLSAWKDRALIEATVGGLAIALIWLLATSLRRRVRERQEQGEARVAQIARLTRVSTELMACHSVRDALERVSRAARELVPAHRALASMTSRLSFSDVVRCSNLSDKYAKWRDFDAPADGSGIHRLLIEHRYPIRMTQTELESHPDWKAFSAYK